MEFRENGEPGHRALRDAAVVHVAVRELIRSFTDTPIERVALFIDAAIRHFLRRPELPARRWRDEIVVKPGDSQPREISGRGHETAPRCPHTEVNPPPSLRLPVQNMVEGGTIGMSGVRKRAFQPERLQHTLAHELLERRTTRLLQHDGKQIDIKGGVVEIRSRLVEQVRVVEILQPLGDIDMFSLQPHGIKYSDQVAIFLVSDDARGVCGELARCDPLPVRVGQFVKIDGNRRIDVDQTVIDHAGKQRSRHRLGGGPDAEQGIGRNLALLLHVGITRGR